MKEKIIRLKRNKKFKILVILSVLLIFWAIDSNAQTRGPILVKKVKTAFERIQDYLIMIATPAAGASVCTGLLMRKFSFGDEEKVRTSKKLIRGSLFAYAFILCTKFVIDLIQLVLR